MIEFRLLAYKKAIDIALKNETNTTELALLSIDMLYHIYELQGDFHKNVYSILSHVDYYRSEIINGNIDEYLMMVRQIGKAINDEVFPFRGIVMSSILRTFLMCEYYFFNDYVLYLRDKHRRINNEIVLLNNDDLIYEYLESLTIA